jgi:hypothetical protein
LQIYTRTSGIQICFGELRKYSKYLTFAGKNKMGANSYFDFDKAVNFPPPVVVVPANPLAGR